MRNLYFRALMAAYLSNMCIKQVSLSKSGSNPYLISEYSIKTKTKTKQLFQRYVDDKNNNVNYKNIFPCHRREAIDHFEVLYGILYVLCIRRLSKTKYSETNILVIFCCLIF